MFFSRRFLPLFITQFLGALNDNLYKSALIVVIAYTADNGSATATIAAGLFILPFFLFSATAGELADKFDKATLAQLIKIAEICIMTLAVIGFKLDSLNFLLTVLFLMGTHSTFFGPIKYALLPQHLKDTELMPANGYIEAGTFLAILLGTLLGGILILQDKGTLLVSIGVLTTAVLGYLASRFIPPAPPAVPELRLSINIARETGRIIGYCYGMRDVFISVMGISWFWVIGATYLAQLPSLCKEILRVEPMMVSIFLTLFSVGIAIGSMLSAVLTRCGNKLRHLAIGAIGMAFFTLDFAVAAHPFAELGQFATWRQFLEGYNGWHLATDLMLIAVFGGLFVVPLYTFMQAKSDTAHRARVIAANNVINALFMVLSAIAAVALFSSGYQATAILTITGILTLPVAVYFYRFSRTRQL